MGKGNYLLELLYPPRCAMCGELLDASDEKKCFCDRCRSLWEQAKEEICPNCRRDAQHCVCEPKYNRSRTVDSYRATVLYNNEKIKKLIYKIKTGYDAALYDAMAKELALSVMKYCQTDENSCLSYPKRSKASVREYGLDHAKKLCYEISKLTNIPVLDVIRHRRGAEQKTLSAGQRGENAAQSYYIRDNDKIKVKDKRIIFIDDVVTTGATTVVCAALCKAAGAKGFYVISIARTP